MTNYEKFKAVIDSYLTQNGVSVVYESTLQDTSFNKEEKTFLYLGEKNLNVISMDDIAQKAYHSVKKAYGNPLNTADAFVINKDNHWYFIEFKDTRVEGKKASKTTKDNIEKKGMANWLMLLDILFQSRDSFDSSLFDCSDPFEFARKHITYIFVFRADKNPLLEGYVRDAIRVKEKYTPGWLMKMKDYFFFDAYTYSDLVFEQQFVKNFSYQ